MPIITRVKAKEVAILDAFYYRSNNTIVKLMWLGIVLYVGFAIVDTYSVQTGLKEVLTIRLLIVSPILIFQSIIQFFIRKTNHTKLNLLLFVLIGALGILAFMFYLKPDETAYKTYYIGLILIFLFSQIVFLPYYISWRFVLLIVILYNITSIFIMKMVFYDFGLFITSNCFIISSLVIGWYSSRLLANAILLDHEKTQALNKTNIKLQELNDIRQKFISILSHDIKEPLNGISGILGLYERNNISQEELLKFNENLKISVESTTQILSSIVQWSKTIYNKQSSKTSSFNLHDLVDEVLAKYTLHAQTKYIQLINNIKQNVCITTDTDVLKLTLRNLISNSLKFTNEGIIEITFCTIPNMYQINIADTGVGMSPEKVNSFNDSGIINSQSGTKGEKGYGLGLIMCRDFLNTIEAKLHVESEIGKGSVFTITIPKLTNGDNGHNFE